MVQVVASPTYKAFRLADMHTTPLGNASGLLISAQEHIQLANIPGSRKAIICHNSAARDDFLKIDCGGKLRAATKSLNLDLPAVLQRQFDFFLQGLDFIQ